MKTIDMIIRARDTGRNYINKDMLYSDELGFVSKNNLKLWDAQAFDTLNELIHDDGEYLDGWELGGYIEVMTGLPIFIQDSNSIKIEDLEVGMKVIIRNDLEEGEFYEGVYFAEDMSCYLGKIVTIREIDLKSFKVKEGDKFDRNDWYFAPEMILSIIPKEEVKETKTIEQSSTKVHVSNHTLNHAEYPYSTWLELRFKILEHELKLSNESLIFTLEDRNDHFETAMDKIYWIDDCVADRMVNLLKLENFKNENGHNLSYDIIGECIVKGIEYNEMILELKEKGFIYEDN